MSVDDNSDKTTKAAITLQPTVWYTMAIKKVWGWGWGWGCSKSSNPSHNFF